MKKNVYRQSTECILEDMGGDVLLYHPATAKAMQLNESSVLIWRLCDGSRTVAEIIDAISEAYPDQAEQITEDVRDTIVMLTESQALQRVG